VTTKDLIKILQELDPTGNSPVFLGDFCDYLKELNSISEIERLRLHHVAEDANEFLFDSYESDPGCWEESLMLSHSLGKKLPPRPTNGYFITICQVGENSEDDEETS